MQFGWHSLDKRTNKRTEKYKNVALKNRFTLF